jgi:RNA polymerase sigma-70 factor (ECF subfamily)
MTQPAIALDDQQRSDERDLIARVLRGDRVAGRMLYDAHAPRVYGLVYRMCGDRQLADELTQDAFVRAFARLDGFRGESAFGTWLHRIAVTVALNAMRKVRRLHKREVELDDADRVNESDGPTDPHLRARLIQAIEALPDGMRVALIMHDIEGYTHQEIADTLGIAVGTSKSRLFDARTRLRAALADLAQG